MSDLLLSSTKKYNLTLYYERAIIVYNQYQRSLLKLIELGLLSPLKVKQKSLAQFAVVI